MLKHPTRKELWVYVEGLAKGHVSAKTAGHVTHCRTCSAEVASMRASLDFVAKAPQLASPDNLTAQILVAAQGARRAPSPTRRRLRTAFGVGKGLFYAAATVAFAVASFRAAIVPSTGHATAAILGALPEKDGTAFSTDEIRRTAAQIQTLSAALDSCKESPTSLQEWRSRRTVLAVDADLSAALAALKRNPGCMRAGKLVNSSLQRQAAALKMLYAERSL